MNGKKRSDAIDAADADSELSRHWFRKGGISIPAKVQEFIENGDFDLEDLERCIISAQDIQKVEADELATPIDGCKYTILGLDTHGICFYTCGKIIRVPDDQKLYFFITAHEQQ